jgi:phosphatidate cytidylyltransferase
MITVLPLVPVVLAALFLVSPWPMFAITVLVAGLAGSEIGRMLQVPKGLAQAVAVATVFLLIVTGLPTRETPPPFAVVILFLAGIAAAWFAAAKGSKGPLLGLIASGWVAGPLACLLLLHGPGPSGEVWHFATPVLLAILPLWAGDIAAIFVGRAFGKHPLAPKVSPKKTWEGAIANLLACLATAVPLGLWIGFDWLPSLLCGLSAGILGQAGDLFESFVKRQAGLKDSGTILPGHGGIMDRIDSTLFTAPAVALILHLTHSG